MVKRIRKYLPETHPDLLDEWDNVKNGNLRPEDVTYGSHKKAWWLCRYKKHSWKAIIKNRARNGNGCPVCAGKLVTECNSLKKLRPDLVFEWDFEKNLINPLKVGLGSNKKVWWKCSNCKHSWKAVVASRVSGCNCPACSGRVATKDNNLFVLRPDLCKEWDFERNKETPSMYKVGSDKKVWWACFSCMYSWFTSIYTRTRGSGCPACAGRVATETNNLESKSPCLLPEWDYFKNNKNPRDYTNMSSKKVWWKCRKCDHGWYTHISSRSKGHGCPACAGMAVTSKNNLAVRFPEIAKEWDYIKNEFLPIDVYWGSERSAYWVCKVCSYEWKVMISARTRGTFSGCLACANLVVTDKNCLKSKFPELCEEWDYTRNSVKPKEVVFGSSKKVWWKCRVCRHKWKTTIDKRTGKKTGCPLCAKGPISKISQKWLDSLNIKIREHYIKDLGFRVDGFDPKTNIVYEFLGDYWHGNPEIYSAEEINSTNKKSFGQLHEETFRRFRILEEAGYSVIYIWESKYNGNDTQQFKKRNKGSV